MSAADADKLSPRSLAAYERMCEVVLQVALKGEEKHPEDAFLQTDPMEHLESASDHLEKCEDWGMDSRDSETDAPDWAHAVWRVAMAAEVAETGG